MRTITAKYVQRDEDWTVTVSGLGKTLNGEASGIIAARDRADQLVEQLTGEGTAPTVVHLLNGSAYEFTSTYMTARLTRSPEEAPAAEQQTATGSTGSTDGTEAVEADEGTDTAETADTADSDAAADAPAEDTAPKRDESGTKPAVPRKALSHEPENTPHRYAHAG
ncbi:hypothetical protein ACWGRK_18490 [Saccharomonospora azurea]|uniref:hypothetical protein n=1 Tax=Saccharomonospora azurea TaxID=40988 RepID=UPI0002400F53|nr:hypothetical protein [Saccharomonospora azurea]EHK87858.1 hypothetical protein SZMC14600_08038 [Saccharomonospora azurea SZMC 14600]